MAKRNEGIKLLRSVSLHTTFSVTAILLTSLALQVNGQTDVPVTVHETACGTKFTDPSSSTILADVVLQGNVEQLRQASPLAPLLYKAYVTVHKVYKGRELLSGVGGEEGGDSSDSNHTGRARGFVRNIEVERFGPDENRESCVARVLTGNTYLFFLRVKDVGVRGQRAPSASPSTLRRGGDVTESSHDALLLVNTALPFEMDLKALRQVKKVLCPDCAAVPVIKRLRCKHCATPPRIKRKMTANDTRTVKAGKKLSLRCVARGTPRPSYTWLKDGRVLHRPEEGEGAASGRGKASVFRSGSLMIRDARHYSLLVIKKMKPEDQGTYRCLAANAMGEEQQSVQVVVKGRPRPSSTRSDPDPAERPSLSRTDPNQAERPSLSRTEPDQTERPSPLQPDLEQGSFIDPCASDPCYNGGTCRRDALLPRRPHCDCLPEFHGRKCQFKRRRAVAETEEDHSLEGNVPQSTDDQSSPVQNNNIDSRQQPINSDISDAEHTSTLQSPSGSNNNIPNNEDTHNTADDNSQGNEQITSKGHLTKKKRRKNASSSSRGRYGTVSSDVKNSKSSAPQLKVSECPDADYCLNGGTCKIVVKIQRKFCECLRGFVGRRCERQI
ncbi:uncharacterized protein [Littorina saxatilis]|uniref:Uncharacterized protein n=1 Tax=Littorina saxatilis TaxID=31220 RepID=A0AAN9BF29_9CAEN